MKTTGDSFQAANAMACQAERTISIEVDIDVADVVLGFCFALFVSLNSKY